jgi:EAL domain-containing protein (putative c-di-GMP-specific phosphodiesterase class I)
MLFESDEGFPERVSEPIQDTEPLEGARALDRAEVAAFFGFRTDGVLGQAMQLETRSDRPPEALHHLNRLQTLRREAVGRLDELNSHLLSLLGLPFSFERALDRLWLAYQPIVCCSEKKVLAMECLVRSDEPALASPLRLLGAAERLGTMHVLGRLIRARCAAAASQAGSPSLFVNLHAADLLDEELYSPAAPLSRVAARVVLEITERAPLDDIDDVQGRIARLRELGYAVAVDDLGAGYAGLTSLALLQPEFVKLDLSLIRDVHVNPTKRKLVRSMASLCRDLGIRVIAEGVETTEERDVVLECGCDLLQGYLFAKPARNFPSVQW